MRRAGIAFVSIALVAIVALPALAGTSDATFRDSFGTQSYSGNDGDRDFSGPWIEMGESNGPKVGYVWVWDHAYCEGQFCLQLGGIDQEAAGHGAYRAVDLSEATLATLTFDYGRELLGEDSAGVGVVEVSPNNGGSWTTVKTIILDGADAGLAHHKSVDISDWATEATLVRFRITEAEGLQMYWLIDNVTIQAEFEPPVTTTSTSTSTSTSTTSTTKPRGTTTTSKPSTSSTTTTRPKATTTTTRPEPTTTTTVARTDETTTTTVARATTTTEAPPAPGSDMSDDDHDMMVEKRGLAIIAAAPPMAMPSLASPGETADRPHAEPVEALAAAFFTESGEYGGNLLPSVLLGIVIAVVTLIGIGKRNQN